MSAEKKFDGQVRRATASDMPGILHCLRIAFLPYQRQYTPDAFRDTVLDSTLLEQRLAAMAVFVAVDSRSDVIGTVAAATTSAAEGHLRGMAVLPDWHGTEVAGLLLAAAEQYLAHAGCSFVTLDTTEPLSRAMGFYEKHGYRLTGRVQAFFGMDLFERRKDMERQNSSHDERDIETLLSRLRDCVNSGADRHAKASSAASLLREWMQLRWAGVYDVDLQRNLVGVIAWSGPNAPTFPEFAANEGITGRAIRKGSIVNVGDVAMDADYLTALPTTRSEVVVPVFAADGSIVGTVDIESAEPNAFDTAHEKLLVRCAEAMLPLWLK